VKILPMICNNLEMVPDRV